MKVLQINSVCGIRSTGRICTDIADTLREYGHDCKVAYGRENIPHQYRETAVRIGNDRDVKFHAVTSRLFDNTGKGSRKATREFLKWVDEYNPDVIHLHNIHGYYINIKMLFDYLKKANKPVVWTMHDCWAFTGHCSHFDYIGCQKWKNGGCNNCPQKKSYPSSILLDRSRKNFIEKKQYFQGLKNLTIVTPSQWLADKVSESFLKDYPIKVIHNGIDLTQFSPNENSNFRDKYDLVDKVIFLGVASAWKKAKGLYDFYKINEMKSDREAVVLVGLTKQQMSDLPEGIIGIERTNSISELAEIYTTADVFINPTYAEAFGLTNIEAQACGTPAVTYRAGGSPEGVLSENVVERGDVKVLLNRAREVILSPKTMDVSVFSKENCYAEYIELYRKILDRL